VPTSISVPIDHLITSCWSRPVQIVSHIVDSMVLDVYPRVGIVPVSSCLRGALMNFVPKRKRGRVMAWRAVSHKPRVTNDVTVKSILNDGLRVTCRGPVDLQFVIKTVKRCATDILNKGRIVVRSDANWRGAPYYKSMFRIVDLFGISNIWAQEKLDAGLLAKVS